jgi:hypothetical protein
MAYFLDNQASAHGFMSILGVDRCFEIAKDFPLDDYFSFLSPVCHRLIERGDVKKVQQLFEEKEIPYLDYVVLYSFLLYGYIDTAIKMAKRAEPDSYKSEGLKTIADFLITTGEIERAKSCIEEIPDEQRKQIAQKNLED